MLLLCVLLMASSQAQIQEQKAIEFTKGLSVAVLDSTLSHMRLSDWITEIVGDSVTVQWELNDCGEQTGVPSIDSQRDIPACVEAFIALPKNHNLSITILVGTSNRGLVDSPMVFNIDVVSADTFRTIKRLSELKNIMIHFIR